MKVNRLLRLTLALSNPWPLLNIQLLPQGIEKVSRSERIVGGSSEPEMVFKVFRDLQDA